MTEKKYTYQYKAYGLKVASQIPVEGFVNASFETADVYISEGMVPKNLTKVINQGVLFQSNEQEYIFHLEHVLALHVEEGNQITVQKYGNISMAEISAFIIGNAFGIIFQQRDMLPLHACAVQYQEKCLLFAGFSGSGKTTLALTMLKSGAMLMADDLSVIDFNGAKPAVIPAFAMIKVWDDSLKHLGYPSTGLKRVREGIEKFYLPVENFMSKPMSIDRIFILRTHNEPETSILPLSGMDKFKLMQRNTHQFRSIKGTRHEQNHFHLTTRLIHEVPVVLLLRPKGNLNMEHFISLLDDYLARL
jgi:hypothetical protein